MFFVLVFIYRPALREGRGSQLFKRAEGRGELIIHRVFRIVFYFLLYFKY